MILPMRLLIGCVALLVAANAAAQIYRWTDEKGRVVYGNEPPAGAKPDVVQDRINSYGGPPEGRQAPAVSAAPARAQARAYFAKKGVSYVAYDIEQSAAASAEFKRLGGRGVPLIVHGTNVMRG